MKSSGSLHLGRCRLPPAQTAVWDALDFFFREGGKQAYVASYASGASGGDPWTAGLDLFGPKLGPGQVSVIGAPASETLYTDLATHAQANNRVALADTANTGVLGTLVSNGGMLPEYNGLGSLAEYIALFGGWAKGPAPAGVIGFGQRTVPASPVIAALCARVDGNGNPNTMAGGRDYPLTYVQDLVLDPSDDDRSTLITAGVNPFSDVWGVLENYAFRTPVPKDPSTPFWQLNCSRTRMYMTANAQPIGEKYYGKTIDGQGLLANALGQDLDEMLLALYGANALYGDTAQDAFNVNIGVTVNTAAEAANATLKAVAQARLSLYADTVEIDLVSVPVAGTIVS